jgi:pimeloyl-ACP methyl ester carboxylesterase
MDLEGVVARWGKGLGADLFAPTRKGDPKLREQFGRLQVQSATPHDAVAFMRMAFEIDVRDVVPAVTAPTLLIVGGADPIVLDLNRRAQAELRCVNLLDVVEGATHLFEEPGALAEVAILARDWFVTHLSPGEDTRAEGTHQ